MFVSSSISFIKFCATVMLILPSEGGVVEMRGGSSLRDLPVFSMKGERPMDALNVFMMLKHTFGSTFAQHF